MRRPGRMRALAAALGVLAGAASAGAASVKIWVSDSAADFSLGEARGVSVAADGSLLAGKSLSKVEGVTESVLFTAVPGRSGELYVGTGDAGRILRVDASGKVDDWATLPEQEVTALALGPDRAVYAGASPGGKIYRIAEGKATTYYETRAQYVWALAFAGPDLYVATGLPGEIHRIRTGGKGERVHATPDAHVRTLYADGKGRVWAGTSGSGLVLRIDATGHVTTLYDSSKPEITAIRGDKEGRVWAAAGAADGSGSSSEPISVPVASPPPRSVKTGSPTDEDDRTRPEVSVSVSAPRIATSRSASRGGYSSEIILFEEGEPPRSVWSAAEEVVFDLARDEDGEGVVAATGPRGKLYAIAPDSSSLVRTFDEKQVTFLAGGDVGTNASTALYRRRPGVSTGDYVSAVKDTGRTSRFGAFRWEGDEPGGTRVEFAFRSGESAMPDTTWSEWSVWTGGEKTLRIDAPDGRYLQWRARLEASGERSPRVLRTEAAYRNRNAAPLIESLTAMEPAEVLTRTSSSGTHIFESAAPDEKGIFTSLEESRSEGSPRRLLRKGYRTLQWKVTDPDGDALAYGLEFRPTGSAKWIPLRQDVRDTSYSFDTTALPDGDYVFRLTASDAEGNPGEEKTATRESSPIRLDNTPPEIRELSRAAGTLEVEVRDEASPVTEVEYSVDAKRWTRAEPEDGLADSPAETYRLRLPAEARGAYLLIRATDASRNTAAASLTAP